MADSPASGAATSDAEPMSSPMRKSFASRAPDFDDASRLTDAPDETSEKSSRAKGKPTGKDRDKDKDKDKDKEKEKDSQPQFGKIRHLKKEDGEPLWREDIQYDFLKAVFDDEQKVFTNSYEPDGLGKQNFADLYIDTMSRSTKTSKVLRDKLLSDREAAKGMAMVCLLVNVGRMNTTLNFFPEMRAQLRTYHAIPSLQAHQDPHAYKQLQDAPRLKSILKGGAEDRDEPNSLDKIKEQDIPRTNPVNLIFVMCNAASKVAELHFPRHHEFHDLIMKTQYSSASRAKAFLWLMWFYLESDFTEEGCEENPFGAGVDYGLGVANQGVPKLDKMTDEEKKKENVDPEEELEFGREKQKMRAKILEMDQAYLNERENRRGKMRLPFAEDGPAILPRIRPSKHESDMDSTRSTPPPKAASRASAAASTRRGAPLKYQIIEGSSPARGTEGGVMARKPRPPTAHQLAVERNRHERVEYILERGLRRQQHKSRKLRRQHGAVFQAYRRTKAQADPLEDSDMDENSPRNLQSSRQPFRERGIGGLSLLTAEKDDFGEEVFSYAAALRRANRRLVRWVGRDAALGVVAPVKKKKQPGEGDDGDKTGLGLGQDGLSTAMSKLNDELNGDVSMLDIELEDQTALGDDERADEDMDDPDRTEVMGDSDAE
ncbi:unnamed protein product [Clonostachys rosea]|uniref:INO80 chromatin remodeling complex Ies1 n=1 Tax=Bionectria ochroleuca TaxID=29856 RepID=A0ABY6TST7_BIOOC|nr:unnamed protein product [Clonostachys rosea]